jgi:putative peptidoglycan lipid II flippase
VSAPAALRAPAPMRRLWMLFATVAGLTIAVKGAAFGKDFVVAWRFGAGATLDVFLLACLLPTYATGALGGAIPSVLVPVQQQVERRGSFASLLPLIAGRTVALGIVLSLLLAIGTTLLSNRVTSSWSSGTRQEIVVSSVLLFPFVTLQLLAGVWGAALTARNRIGWATASQVAIPLCVAAVAVLPGDFGPRTLAVGMTVGALLQLSLLLWPLREVQLPAAIAWRDRHAEHGEALTAYWAALWPAAASALLGSSANVIDQSMAADLGPQAVSYLTYGSKLTALVLTIVISAATTVLLPQFSALAAAGKFDALRALWRRTSLLLVVGGVVATLVLASSAPLIIRLLFERGAFTETDTAAVALVQQRFALQLAPHLFSLVAARVLSSLSGNRVLLWNAMLCVPLDIALNWWLGRTYGVSGIALSTSVVKVVSALVLGVTAWRWLEQRIAAEQVGVASERAL